MGHRENAQAQCSGVWLRVGEGHGWEGSVAAQSRGVQTSASHREMVPLQLLMGFVPAGRSSSAISSFASDSLM